MESYYCFVVLDHDANAYNITKRGTLVSIADFRSVATWLCTDIRCGIDQWPRLMSSRNALLHSQTNGTKLVELAHIRVPVGI